VAFLHDQVSRNLSIVLSHRCPTVLLSSVVGERERERETELPIESMGAK
jgi:hypothetical protein